MKQLSIYENDYLDDINTLNHVCHSSESNASSATSPAAFHKLPVNLSDSNKDSLSSSRKSTETQTFPANVTEIVLAKDTVDSIQLVLPMLINLHQETRWLAWIDPPIQLLKEWQKTHQSSALNDIMILRSNENLSVYELSKRALEAGTCHAVIAWTNTLNQEEFSKLETASSKGNSHGIILKSRR